MGRLVNIFTSFIFVSCLLILGASIRLSAQTAESEDFRNLRGSDRACIQCHKEQDHRMLGGHKKAVNPNNSDQVTCTNCHGHPSLLHREGGKDVMNFSAKSTQPLDQRNGICLSCHEIPDLRKKMWAHDVHVTKTRCTSCHQLHPIEDPMRGLSEKSRIKLCVDCHGKLHERQKAKQGMP